jgi:hypothetical protein
MNWFGPSDFSNPEVPPFPPGRYVFTPEIDGTRATANGSNPFFVRGTFGITILP